MEKPILKLDNICLSIIEKRKGKEVYHNLIQNLDLEVYPGEFVVILGDSGSGKTTFLDIVAGFVLLDEASNNRKLKVSSNTYLKTSGKIFVNGQDVSNEGPISRNVGLVMQRFTLYEHMSVLKNLLFPLKWNNGKSKINNLRKIVTILHKVGLSNSEIKNCKPDDLSGGQRQRIAIAKMLIREPTIRLFDEAFSHLDFKLRSQLRNELIISPLRNGPKDHIVIFVSHDLNDAKNADQILYFETKKNLISNKHKQQMRIEINTIHKLYVADGSKNAYELFSSANDIDVIELISTIKNKEQLNGETN